MKNRHPRLSVRLKRARSLAGGLALALLGPAVQASLVPTLQAQSAPVVSAVFPDTGAVGTSVRISGSRFGDTQGDATVTFNGVSAQPILWSKGRIRLLVPSGARTGPVVVTVGGQASNKDVVFTVAAPSVSSLRPDTGKVGTSVRINGAHFGPTQGNSTVTFDGTEATPTRWGDRRVRVTVPSGAVTGNVVVTVDGLASNGAGFTVTTPAIRSLSPASGPPGTAVTVTGANFGAAQGNSTVTFNGLAATPTSWSNTRIVAPVPAGAATGNVVVTVDGVASNGLTFTVIGVRARPTELAIQEGGSGTYTLVLRSRPAAAVTVSMSAPAGTDLSVDLFPVFTPSNWNIPQTVTVSAGEDDDTRNEKDTLTHRTSSTDPNYQRLTLEGVEVRIGDDDGELTVSATELRITEGNSGRYTVALNARPEAAMSVAVAAPSDGDLTVSPTALTFTPDNWNAPQTVTVTVGEDADLSDEVQSITHTVSSAAGAAVGARFAASPTAPPPAREYVYLGDRLVAIVSGSPAPLPPAPAVASVVVTIDDDDDPDTPGVPVMTSRLQLIEGNTGAYTLELGSQPTAEVTIAVSVVPGSDQVEDLSVEPAEMTFTPSNWSIPQWVTVTVGADADTLDETETLSHVVTSEDTDYDGIDVDDVRVDFRDRNRPPPPPADGGITVAPDPCAIPAGQATCRVTVRWNATDTTAIRILKGAEVVKDSTDSSGSLTVDLAEGAHEFKLHDFSGGSLGNQLGDPVTVTVIQGPTGDLTASPDPCTIPDRQATCRVTVEWTSENTTAVQVRRGAGSILVRSGQPNGSATAEIGPGSTTFLLYDYSTGSRGSELDRVTVTARRGPSLDAKPNPCAVPGGENTCKVTLGWTAGSATRIRILKDTVVVKDSTDSSGSLMANLAEGSHEFELHDYSGGRERGELASVTVTVTGGPEPPECSLSASPTDTRSGAPSSLSWTTAGATQASIDQGIGAVTPVAKGSRSVSPISTTTYTLTASGPGGTAECSAAVTVWPKPTAGLTPDPAAIKSGQSSSLSWTTTGATLASIDRGIGAVTPVAEGSRSVSPSSTTNYTLKASNPAWTDSDAASASAAVRVVGGAISASPNPCTVRTGITCTTTLSWSGTGATGLLVRVSHNRAPSTIFASSGRSGSASASWIQAAPAHTYTFLLYDYLSPGDVPFGAGRPLQVMGDRLQAAGKERLDLLGLLTRTGSSAVAVRILWEYPGKVRIEKRLGTVGGDPDPQKEEVLVYDGAGNLRKSRGAAALEDQDMIEMLVHDSVEGFFIGQVEGFATRFLGSRYHRIDAEGNPVGPDYDVYEVINLVRVPGRPLRQRKLYYFNSDTALLERVRYRLQAERGRGPVEVRVEIGRWAEVFGQSIPGEVVRHEDGVEVVKLEIKEAGIAAAAKDGSFTLP